MAGALTRMVGRTGAGAPSDPSFSSVVLLMGFENGADGSTTFVDESSSAKTVTALSQAQIDTAQFKFGTRSCLLDGTNDGLSLADHADWEFGAGQFTIELFVRFNVVTAGIGFLHHTNSSGLGWGLFRNNGLLSFNSTGTTPTSITSAWTPSTGVWYHIAADCDASGVVRLYRDGSFLAKQTGRTAAIDNPAEILAIGRLSYVDLFNINGWVDEVRITKGVARYASDSGYTVPTAAFPRS